MQYYHGCLQSFKHFNYVLFISITMNNTNESGIMICLFGLFGQPTNIQTLSVLMLYRTYKLARKRDHVMHSIFINFQSDTNKILRIQS